MPQILILSAGRRVSLVKAFKEAAHLHSLQVVAGDVNPEMSSACHVADHSIVLPHVHSAEYRDSLVSYCAANDVKLIVPTIDTELAQLSELRDTLHEIGAEAAVSAPSLIRTCRDKRLTATYFADLGIASPTIYEKGQIQFPTLVKPFDGSLSAGISLIHSPDELTPQLNANSKNMFCQYLNPAEYDEYTCDCYFDRQGSIRCVVPRLRIQVRGGEIAKGRTERNVIVPFLFDRLERLEGARGCLTIQIMKHRSTGELYLIEVNPRFGGGYPLTAEAGAAFHSWLIDEYILGREVANFEGWTENLVMLRYDDAVFMTG